MVLQLDSPRYPAVTIRKGG